jgi:hypothetical protein
MTSHSDFVREMSEKDDLRIVNKALGDLIDLTKDDYLDIDALIKEIMTLGKEKFGFSKTAITRQLMLLRSVAEHSGEDIHLSKSIIALANQPDTSIESTGHFGLIAPKDKTLTP